MTAKQLKEALANIPDDAEVCVDNGFILDKLSDCIEYDEYNNRLIIVQQ